MRLYVFEGGQVHLPDLSHLTPDHYFGIPVTIPLLMFLIDHPRGLVVVDTGLDLDTTDDPLLEAKPSQRIDRQMQGLGYNPEDVRYVVLTHLHYDHMGCAPLFPNATFVTRRSELRSAWWPDAYSGGYSFESLLRTRSLPFQQVPDEEVFDVFEDGSILCFDTRGHTEGHQSVLLKLPKSGRIVLTGDAVQVAQNFTEWIPPGVCWNSQLAIQAIDKLHHLQDSGALLIFGHELSQMDTLTLAPGYYD
jgi:N-acyl homoserine lactone hydrolase